MSCILEENGGEQTAILRFKRSELLYDIKNYAYIEGSVMETEDEHLRHTVQDVGEEGNVDRVTRILNLTVAKCREFLFPYTKCEIERSELNDTLKAPEVYGIVMKLPKDYSQTTLTLMERLIHEYLVCTALADWLGITYPEKAEMWALRGEDAERELLVNLNTRRGGSRRIRLHPC